MEVLLILGIGIVVVPAIYYTGVKLATKIRQFPTINPRTREERSQILDEKIEKYLITENSISPDIIGKMTEKEKEDLNKSLQRLEKLESSSFFSSKQSRMIQMKKINNAIIQELTKIANDRNRPDVQTDADAVSTSSSNTTPSPKDLSSEKKLEQMKKDKEDNENKKGQEVNGLVTQIIEGKLEVRTTEYLDIFKVEYMFDDKKAKYGLGLGEKDKIKIFKYTASGEYKSYETIENPEQYDLIKHKIEEAKQREEEAKQREAQEERERKAQEEKEKKAQEVNTLVSQIIDGKLEVRTTEHSGIFQAEYMHDGKKAEYELDLGKEDKIKIFKYTASGEYKSYETIEDSGRYDLIKRKLEEAKQREAQEERERKAQEEKEKKAQEVNALVSQIIEGKLEVRKIDDSLYKLDSGEEKYGLGLGEKDKIKIFKYTASGEYKSYETIENPEQYDLIKHKIEEAKQREEEAKQREKQENERKRAQQEEKEKKAQEVNGLVTQIIEGKLEVRKTNHPNIFKALDSGKAEYMFDLRQTNEIKIFKKNTTSDEYEPYETIKDPGKYVEIKDQLKLQLKLQQEQEKQRIRQAQEQQRLQQIEEQGIRQEEQYRPQLQAATQQQSFQQEQAQQKLQREAKQKELETAIGQYRNNQRLSIENGNGELPDGIKSDNFIFRIQQSDTNTIFVSKKTGSSEEILGNFQDTKFIDKLRIIKLSAQTSGNRSFRSRVADQDSSFHSYSR